MNTGEEKFAKTRPFVEVNDVDKLGKKAGLEIADDEELGLKAKLEARDDSRLNLDNNAIACSVEVINVTSQVT